MILGVPRRALGLTASPKGWYCGSLSLRNRATGLLMWDGRELDVHGMPITASTCRAVVDSSVRIESDARFILVIEKEGVYARLSEDKFFLRHCPSILVTGRGFPDVATRRWVQRLQAVLRIPAYGLCDCNPYGVSVLNTYQYEDSRVRSGGGAGRRRRADRSVGSRGRGSRAGHGLQLQWIGLRPSQVEELDLPPSVFQLLSKLDQRQLTSLLHETHPFQQQGWNPELRLQELEQMDRYKVELEALNWRGMDFLGRFVHRIIQAHEDFGRASSGARGGRRSRRDDSPDEASDGGISPFII
jgi:meiotic recombination protein SPO11